MHRNFQGAFLRMAAIAGKFLLVLYITKYLALEQLGAYGLFVATVEFSVYVIGFDFHAFATRELVLAAPHQRPAILGNQVVFYAFAYVVIIPVTFYAFATGVIAWQHAAWFYVILPASHAAQEIYRVLIAVSHPKAAFLLSSIANGLWSYPVVLLGILIPGFASLQVVFAGWALGAISATCAGLVMMAKLRLLALPSRNVPWPWLVRGVKVSALFVACSLSIKFIDLSPRYFVDRFWGREYAGVYTLFSSVSRVLNEFVFASVVSTTFPLLVKSQSQGDWNGWTLHLKRLVRDTVLSTAALLPVFVAGIYLVVRLLDKPLLSKNLEIYFVLLLGTAALNLSMIPHYVLYARHSDRNLLHASLAGAGCQFFLNVLLVPSHGLLGAAIATAAGFLAMGILKYLPAMHSVVLTPKFEE